MFCVKLSLSSTSFYSKEAADSIKDLYPNAADLLIVTTLASLVTDVGVVSPTSGGLLMYHNGLKGKNYSLDGYFVAPDKFTGNDHEEHRVALTYGGYVETCKGANTFAIPGIYKILDYVYKNFASLPISKLTEFPIKIAKKGFKLTQPSKDYLNHSLVPLFFWHEEAKKTFKFINEDLEQGEVQFLKLADTFEHISNVGFEDFYSGDICRELVSTIKNEGGHATLQDFKNYSLIEDKIFNYKYKNITLTGLSGPSIGGLMVLKYLQALEHSNSILNAFREVYLERKTKYEKFGNRQDLIKSEIKKMTQSPSTIQISTSDEENNHFSLTFSSGYGSGVQCKNTGMFFNNSLGEIELNPQGFLGKTFGERLISNMSPLIVTNENTISAIGSPGADRISSAMAIVLDKYNNSYDWKSAIDEPRFHINEDGLLRHEPNLHFKYNNSETTKEFDMYFGGVCVTGKSNSIFAFGDKRRGDISWLN